MTLSSAITKVMIAIAAAQTCTTCSSVVEAFSSSVPVITMPSIQYQCRAAAHVVPTSAARSPSPGHGRVHWLNLGADSSDCCIASSSSLDGGGIRTCATVATCIGWYQHLPDARHRLCAPSNRSSRVRSKSSWRLPALPFDEDGPIDKPGDVDNFDAKTTAALVAGQSSLVAIAAIAATLLGTANFGLGQGFALSAGALKYGALATIPLFLLAFVLDFVEEVVPALQDVTKATQRSVLALLGRRRKPVVALGTALALGAAAGLGEEMLFRGVLQAELSQLLGDPIALALSSLIFGALHAVTPLYAALASLASIFFGYLYVESQNLAVPIVCHGLYDVGALLWAHWTVTEMPYEEQTEIMNWAGPEDQGGQ